MSIFYKRVLLCLLYREETQLCRERNEGVNLYERLSGLSGRSADPDFIAKFRLEHEVEPQFVDSKMSGNFLQRGREKRSREKQISIEFLYKLL